MSTFSAVVIVISFAIWLFVGLNCALICQSLDFKATGNKDTYSSFIVGLIFGFLGIVYYIGKYLASDNKKD